MFLRLFLECFDETDSFSLDFVSVFWGYFLALLMPEIEISVWEKNHFLDGHASLDMIKRPGA